MSDFKAKIHQIHFGTLLGQLTTPPDPVAVFKGPTSKEREGIRKVGEGGKGEGNGRGK